MKDDLTPVPVTLPPVELAVLDDAALLVLIACRSVTALGALYDRYGGVVFTVARRVTGDEQDATTITEQVFDALWQHAGDDELPVPTLHWLIDQARCRALDKRRGGSQTAQVLAGRVPGMLTGARMLTPPAHLQQHMRTLIAGLPSEQREVLALAYFDGLTCVELARTLDAPVAMVKHWLWLGMTALGVGLGSAGSKAPD